MWGRSRRNVPISREILLAVFKTEEEIQRILQRKENELKRKQERRKKQELNLVQKKLKKEAHKYVMSGIDTKIGCLAQRAGNLPQDFARSRVLATVFF